MKNAKLSVIAFNDGDVIATSTSGGLMCSLTGFGNGVFGDASVTANDASFVFNEYIRSGKDTQDKAFNTLTHVTSGVDTVFYVSEELSDTFMNICLADSTNDLFHTPRMYDAANSAYNGNYLWDGTKFVKQTN